MQFEVLWHLVQSGGARAYGAAVQPHKPNVPKRVTPSSPTHAMGSTPIGKPFALDKFKSLLLLAKASQLRRPLPLGSEGVWATLGLECKRTWVRGRAMDVGWPAIGAARAHARWEGQQQRVRPRRVLSHAASSSARPSCLGWPADGTLSVGALQPPHRTTRRTTNRPGADCCWTPRPCLTPPPLPRPRGPVAMMRGRALFPERTPAAPQVSGVPAPPTPRRCPKGPWPQGGSAHGGTPPALGYIQQNGTANADSAVDCCWSRAGGQAIVRPAGTLFAHFCPQTALSSLVSGGRIVHGDGPHPSGHWPLVKDQPHP